MRIRVQRSAYAAGFRSGWHSCAYAQLIYPSRGVLTLHSREGIWIVPPMRACWLPADQAHDVETPFGLDMLSAYCLSPDDLKRLPAKSGIVAISDLLRAAILALEQPGDRSARRLRTISDLFVDELQLQDQTPLHLPTLASSRLAPIRDRLRSDPADDRSLEDWGRLLGLTTRTLAREFRRGGGMTFTQYRAQLRLHAAIERLAADHPVTAIAYDLGFGSPSNFIATFRKATGLTPGAYFRPVHRSE